MKQLFVFTVSLNAADPRATARKEDQRLLSELLQQALLRPVISESFAGSLNYLEYNFLIRFVLKQISKRAHGPIDTSRNYEMTDWKAVSAFAKRITRKKESELEL